MDRESDADGLPPGSGSGGEDADAKGISIFATDINQMDTDENLVDSITERIIGSCYLVQNTLGCGFAEKV
jgi:hypothetical protein